MSKRPKLPMRSQVQVPELARATQDALDTVPDQQIVVTDPQHYTEPMLVALDDTRVPRIVQCVRVVNALAPEDAVVFGSTSWVSTSGGVKIVDIDGLTADATSYLFTFLVMW